MSRAQSRISVRVKTRVRRLGKIKCARQGDFFALGSIRVEGGDLKEYEPRSLSQEEDQSIQSRFKDEIGLRYSRRLRTKSSWSSSRDHVRDQVDKVSRIEPL
jgi:hypothetical protein